MKKRSVIIFLFISLFGYSQDWFPLDTLANNLRLSYKAFDLSYSPKHKQASWVAYVLSVEEVYGYAKRTNKFLPDERLKDGPKKTDYYRSGFDRGHLAPAADFKNNQEHMNESFYLTNIAPQIHSFNAGKWLSLESFTRSSVKKRGELWVVVGGVLREGLKTIGSGVSVPEYFYKVLYDPKEKSCVAFLMKHEKLTEDLVHYIVSVDDIESITGFDFLSFLPDKEESEIESVVNIAFR